MSASSQSGASVVVEPTHYTFKLTGKVWQIVGELRSQLLASGSWVQATRDDQPAHLLLTDRGRVNFARELIGHRAPSTPARFAALTDPNKASLCMCNVYRGCSELTNKSALVKTMRLYAQERKLTPEQMEYMPSTFVLRPGDSADERSLFLAEFNRTEAAQKAATDAAAASSSAIAAAASSAAASVASSVVPRSKNVWIAKANRGAKGSAIFVSDDAQKLIDYIDAQRDKEEERSAATEASGAALPSSSGTAATPAVPALDLPASAAAASSSAVAAAAAAPASGSISARAPPLRSRLGSSGSSRSGALTSRSVPVKGLAAAASNSWVLQRYLSSPFLLSGRKFDIRCWALLDSAYNVYLYRNGVARTSSTAFSLDNLADQFVHLTNHCIQTAHPDYATKEDGNELFFPALQRYLDTLPTPTTAEGSPLPPHPLCVICHLLPQLRHVVRETLGSVRARLSSAGEYHSFQLFGYDVMLDASFHVRLLEINATPASALHTLQGVVRDLKQRAIDAVYPDHAAASAAAAATTPSSQHRDASASAFSAAAILAQPCHCASMLAAAQMSRADYLSPPDERRINLFDLIG